MNHYQGSIPEWAAATSSASCPAVVVFHRLPAASANERGVAVVVQRDPTGRVSVRSCEAVGDREDGRATNWAEDDSTAWLEAGDVVVAALEAIEARLGISLDWKLVVQELALLDWLSAAVAANKHGQPWPSGAPGSLEAVVFEPCDH